MRTRTSVAAAALIAAAFAAGACGGDERTGPAPGTPTAAAPLPASVLAAAAPEGAKEIGAAKPAAKEGDEVVLRGVVGGSAKPIVAGRAVFTLADPTALVACNQKPGDTCARPWDMCCHTPEEIAAYTVTVQVVGADGRPIAADVEASGVKPLARVVVRGKVGPRPDPRVFVVDASQIHVEK